MGSIKVPHLRGELERLRSALLDLESVVDEDRQAVAGASAKLEASLIARDRVMTRLAALLALHAAEHGA